MEKKGKNLAGSSKKKTRQPLDKSNGETELRPRIDSSVKLKSNTLNDIQFIHSRCDKESDGEQDAETGADSMKSQDDASVPPSVMSRMDPAPKTPGRKGGRGIRQAQELNAKSMADSYFEAQSTKVKFVFYPSKVNLSQLSGEDE